MPCYRAGTMGVNALAQGNHRGMRRWRVATTDEVLTRVRRAANGVAGRPPIVAVDGRSASGKTTFASRLAAAWPGATVVHTDDIAWEQAVLDWVELLAAGVLEPVRAGRAVAFRPPRWEERGRPGVIEVPRTCSLLIVEGVGAGRRELAPLLDAVVWVESPRSEVERRDAQRVATGETTPANYAAWMAEEDPFVEAERTWEAATFVVAGWRVLRHDPATEFVIST
jgi:hypothetical protein